MTQHSGAQIPEQLAALNRAAPQYGQIEVLPPAKLGPALEVAAYRMANGLRILLVESHSAPVFAYHTWFRVGSRHEREGKTGIAHLFEHLMFNETENLPKGEFDRRLETLGAESNASTWLDFTQYSISAPKPHLATVASLEAERMQHLVLRDPQVASEKEVVANERRFRVDDDVEGSVNEVLWSTAFQEHSYRWPTIGWMADIEGFTTEDCDAFYRTYYAPNNATVVVVGAFDTVEALRILQTAYGAIPPSSLPAEPSCVEPPQLEERRVTLTKPTASEKLTVGYHGPALHERDYLVVSVLAEVLFGGRASRVVRRLVRDLELASEARMSLGPFKDPGLIEIYASARGEHTAEELLAVIDEELARVKVEDVAPSEVARAQARFELGQLHGLESTEGKANTIGFYDCVLSSPGAAFERLEAMRTVTPAEVRAAAQRYLVPHARSVILVRASGEEEPLSEEEAEALEGTPLHTEDSEA
jgi:zinc protease